MPQFNVVVRADDRVVFTEGIEAPGSEEARDQATRRFGDLMREDADRLWADEEWLMHVTDEAGLILYMIAMIAHRTSATRRA